MKTLYKAILNKLKDSKTAFTEQGITPVNYIDLFADQYFMPEMFELFAENSVLMDWDIDHTSSPAIATLNIHCCYEQLRFTDNLSANTDLGLKFLDYVDIVHKLVSGVTTAQTGKLELNYEGFIKMDSIVDVYMLTYTCSYNGRTNHKMEYQDGQFEQANIDGNLVEKINPRQGQPWVDYGLGL